MSAQGALDGARVNITPSAPLSPGQASVASDGINNAVVWSDYRAGNKWQVRLALSRVGGGYLAGSEVVIDLPTSETLNPALAWTGNDYAVTYDDPTRAVSLARVSPAGVVVSRGALPIPLSNQMYSHVSWAGCRVAVFYQWMGVGDIAESQGVFVP